MQTIQIIEAARRSPATGPRTPEGKRRSSLNALRHGLTGQVVLMPGDDIEAYQKHCRAAHTDLAPKGFSEFDLVQLIADYSWRLKRHRAHENNILALAYTTTEPNINVTEENATGDNAATAIVSAVAYRDSARELELLSLYEHRLHRQYCKAQADLERLQTARRAAEQMALEEAALIKSFYDEEEDRAAASQRRPRVAFNPAAHQFVYSNAEIDSQIRRHNALSQARAMVKRRHDTLYAAA